ncbi:DUF6680 family protein [Sphingomonas sp. PP-F2F-G114-C0414]|uniref:DUF6680 family protein n=1 Tax=Sphingomonas sp. PP-F2F-G114-C0414 TaxID=2135662 RepID=UPI000EF8AFD0|nr:DUF6680 family protein [Sphingomonas sp. PP-F2F-G114-C0414]
MMANAVVVANWTFKIADVAIIFATLIGPILAVQAQKWLEKGRAINDRRSAIFRALMATRTARLSPGHVEALNAVPVEFYGDKGKLKQINNAWKSYLDHHAPDTIANEAWSQKREDLYIDLLLLISEYLGYDFSRSQLTRDVYNPQAHGELENEQTIIRKGIVKLFKGELAIPMAVTEFPATVDEATFDNQAALAKLLTEWLEGQRAVKVEIPNEDAAK